jgi:hypothetical protein
MHLLCSLPRLLRVKARLGLGLPHTGDVWSWAVLTSSEHSFTTTAHKPPTAVHVAVPHHCFTEPRTITKGFTLALCSFARSLIVPSWPALAYALSQNCLIYKSTSMKTTIEIVVITYLSPYKPGSLQNLEGSQTFSTYSQDHNGSVIIVHMLT